MLTFVLVHGAWHDGSCWNDVISELRELGHSAFAPTLAGNGFKVQKQGMTHAATCQSVVDFVEDKDLQDFILVGHSYGGSIIQKVAEAIPQRISRLVFQNAFVLRDGQCLLDENPRNTSLLWRV